MENFRDDPVGGYGWEDEVSARESSASSSLASNHPDRVVDPIEPLAVKQRRFVDVSLLLLHEVDSSSVEKRSTDAQRYRASNALTADFCNLPQRWRKLFDIR